jgi:hypothetical protein
MRDTDQKIQTFDSGVGRSRTGFPVSDKEKCCSAYKKRADGVVLQ